MSGQCAGAGYVCLSAPSPCERRYRLRVVWTDPTPCRLRLSYLVFRSAYLSPIGDCAHVPAQERTGSPKPALSEVEGFLRLLSTHTPLSGGLRQTLQNLACCSDSLVWASRPLTRSPSALEAPEGAPYPYLEAVSSFRACGRPYGLRGSLCPLQLFRSAYAS
jgi:hypothetical protein